MCIFLSHVHAEMTQTIENRPRGRISPHRLYHGCRCPGDTRSQGNGCHGITWFSQNVPPHCHGHNWRVINHNKRHSNARIVNLIIGMPCINPQRNTNHMDVAQTTRLWHDFQPGLKQYWGRDKMALFANYIFKSIFLIKWLLHFY